MKLIISYFGFNSDRKFTYYIVTERVAHSLNMIVRDSFRCLVDRTLRIPLSPTNVKGQGPSVLLKI